MALWIVVVLFWMKRVI